MNSTEKMEMRTSLQHDVDSLQKKMVKLGRIVTKAESGSLTYHIAYKATVNLVKSINAANAAIDALR